MITRSALEFSPGAAGPVLGRDRHNWRDSALCDGMDPDIFFPADEENPEQAAAAKAACATCPGRPGCLAFALAERIYSGIWGGTTGRERLRMPVPERTHCRSGLHVRTAANTGDEGRCLACKQERETRLREEERVLRTGSTSPRSGSTNKTRPRDGCGQWLAA